MKRDEYIKFLFSRLSEFSPAFAFFFYSSLDLITERGGNVFVCAMDSFIDTTTLDKR